MRTAAGPGERRREASRGGRRAGLGSALLTIALFSGCASSTPPEEEEIPSAQSYYEQGLEKLDGKTTMFFFTDVDYPGAVRLFQEVIDNYPYSEYATLAELQIADVLFMRRNYEEAQSFYQDFVELHPNHERVPYAIYRNGLCSFERMREHDQDRGPTQDAVAQFSVLIERYPDSDLVPEARRYFGEAQDHLAQADVAVGDFYFRRGEYHASVRRYRQALTSYPQHGKRACTLAKLGISLKRLHRYDDAEPLLSQALALDACDDELLDEVRFELDDLGGLDAAGFRPLIRSCITDPGPDCERRTEN